MPEVEHSEFKIVKLLDAATPKLFSEDAFVFDGTNRDAIPDGTSNTVFFSEKYDAVDSQASHSGGINVCWGDGSVRTTDTSAVATLQDFDWPSSSSDTPDAPVLVTDADAEGAIAGIVIAATSDNNRDAGADYSGSHVLYQDVFIPMLDTETLTIAHEGYWY